MATDVTYLYKHIVVVHGIGDQSPNETVLGFMNEFMRVLRHGEGDRYAIEVHNLIESVDDIQEEASDDSGESRPQRTFTPAYFVFTDKAKNIHHVIGFSEVYWKHIPDKYLDRNNGNPPIPIFTWAHSINARFLSSGHQFDLAKQAIDNLEKMLGLLRSLAAIYKQSGKFVEILNNFLGDVQVYAESDAIRHEINKRFLDVLSRIKEFSEDTEKKTGFEGLSDSLEIYIIAHSEGTVVSFNSLVQAAQQQESDDKNNGWISDVKGLVTLGSPLDKHYTIWRNRFKQNNLSADLPEPIRWFNYWDHSDPVGYGLKVFFDPDEETKATLKADGKTDAQRLCSHEYDGGFTRYPIPGKAHIDYWKDRDIYEDIIHRCMKIRSDHGDTTVKSKWWAFLQPWGDMLAYIIGRVATIIGIVYFLIKLVSYPKLADSLSGVAEMFPSDNWWHHALWLLAPLVLIVILEKAYIHAKGKIGTFIYWLRRSLVIAWGVVVFALCLKVSDIFESVAASEGTIKDRVGYFIGFVAFLLIWKAHTTIHLGLLQMWRYTRGEGTKYSS